MDGSATDGWAPSIRRTVSLAGAVAGVAAGVVATGIATQRAVDRAVDRLPSRGRDVVVDGRRVHVEVWGSDDAAAPVVVADSGVGGTSADWERVAELVDSDVRIVAVDRPGLGRSEPGTPPDVGASLRRLEAVVTALDVPGPVVLAGWSMGALLWLGVTFERPDLVAGLVLVDPSHPEEAWRFGDPALHPLGRGMWRAVGLASRMGGAALAGVPSRLAYLRLSRGRGRDPGWQMPTFATARAGQALASEMLAFPAVCDEVGEIHAATVAERRGVELGVPCLLLSASRRRSGAESAAWSEMHDDLATWVPGTELLVVDRSGHDMLADRPDVVADAIGRVVTASDR